jgi:hypothetical protein
MSNVFRVRVLWTGGVPGGGISTFYRDDTTPIDLSNLKTFFTALAPFLPPAVTITIPNNVDSINVENGGLAANLPATGSGTVVGTGNSAFSSGVGAFINWQTGVVVGRRMLKGRTFVAPLAQGYASTDGTLNDSLRGSLDTAALALVGHAEYFIWHRPTPAAPTSGVAHLITSAQTIDRVTALKTRRY